MLLTVRIVELWTYLLKHASDVLFLVACEGSVSVGFTARSMYFSLFGGAKIGASTTTALFCALPNFREFKMRKCFKPAESPT